MKHILGLPLIVFLALAPGQMVEQFIGQKPHLPESPEPSAATPN